MEKESWVLVGFVVFMIIFILGSWLLGMWLTKEKRSTR